MQVKVVALGAKKSKKSRFDVGLDSPGFDCRCTTVRGCGGALFVWVRFASKPSKNCRSPTRLAHRARTSAAGQVEEFRFNGAEDDKLSWYREQRQSENAGGIT